MIEDWVVSLGSGVQSYTLHWVSIDGWQETHFTCAGIGQ